MADDLSCAELDAELSRLLLEEPAAPLPRPPPPVPPVPLAPPPVARDADVVVALEARVASLEQLLDERLEALQALAEERIHAAAIDAALAVRRALFGDAEHNADDAAEQ